VTHSVAGETVARIAPGELDELRGCFIDATADLDAAVAAAGKDGDWLELRLTA